LQFLSAVIFVALYREWIARKVPDETWRKRPVRRWRCAGDAISTLFFAEKLAERTPEYFLSRKDQISLWVQMHAAALNYNARTASGVVPSIRHGMSDPGN
jgi:hypothetical protein